MKKILLLLLFVGAMLVGASCESSTPPNLESEQIKIESVENPRVIDEAEYYQLLLGDNNIYYYYIYDENKDTVLEGGFYWRSPVLSMLGDNIVKFRHQAGTGIGTAWTFYYDAKNNEFSQTYYSVYDETDELLVRSHYRMLIVRDIFYKGFTFYREFTEFSYDVSEDVIEPFVDVKFIDNNQLSVTYITGDDYERVSEIIDLR